MQKHLLAAIKTGATDIDACAYAGIAQSTFYDWIARGANEPDTEFSEFSEAVTRARASAKMTAIGTLHSAMMPTETVKRTKHTLKETRVNTWGKEFIYEKTEEDEFTVHAPGDWRAAVEYLKRRHGNEWGDKQTNVNYNVDPALMEKLFKSLDAAGLNASDVFNELIAVAANEIHSNPSDQQRES